MRRKETTNGERVGKNAAIEDDEFGNCEKGASNNKAKVKVVEQSLSVCPIWPSEFFITSFEMTQLYISTPTGILN